MQPLADFSVNRPRRTHVERDIGSPSKPQPPPLGSRRETSYLAAPSSVQSMLKNTTELGNLGQLPDKPVRISRQRSNIMLYPRPHMSRLPREQYRGPTGHHHPSRSVRRYRYAAAHQNSVFHGTGPASGAVVSRYDQRSESLTQSSFTSASLSIRPSLTDMYQRGQGNVWPPSPSTYLSRLKRRRRPGSPAFSEINRSDPCLHLSVRRADSTRTTSPLSAPTSKKDKSGGHGFNNPDLLPQHSFLLHTRDDIDKRPLFLPNSSLTFLEKSNPPLGSQVLTSLGPSSSASESESSIARQPLFYDYSEAFEKETFNHTAQRASLFLAQHPQRNSNEQGQSTSGEHDEDKTQLLFAPNASSPQAVDRSQDEVKIKSPQSSSSGPLKRNSQQGNKEDVSAESYIPGAKGAEMKTKIAHQLPTTVNNQSGSSDGSQDNSQDSSQGRDIPTETDSKVRDRALEYLPGTASLTLPRAIYDPAPKLVRAASHRMRLSSSSSGSVYSTNSSLQRERRLQPSPIKVPDVVYQRHAKALSASLARFDGVQRSLGQTENQNRAVSLDERLRPRSMPIFAPVPERSMSSQDPKDRFSHLLSFGDGQGKADAFISRSPSKEELTTVHQGPSNKLRESPKSSQTEEFRNDRLLVGTTHTPHKGKQKEIQRHPTVDDNFSPEPCESPTGSKRWLDHNDIGFSPNGLKRLIGMIDFASPGVPQRKSSAFQTSPFDVRGFSSRKSAKVMSQIAKLDKKNDGVSNKPVSLYRPSHSQSLKELPPLSNDSAGSIPPPFETNLDELPCSFTPISSEEDAPSIEGWKPEVSLKSGSTSSDMVEQCTPPQKFKVRLRAIQTDTASPPSSRPWNLDNSYPWSCSPPKLEVKLPQNFNGSNQGGEKFPRFKFRMKRLSLPTGPNLFKVRPSDIVAPRLQTSGDQASPMEISCPKKPQDINATSPSITLIPPSPGLNLEVQSFFSDDSSQVQPKRSLRKRLSQIRGIASRTASTDDFKGSDRGLLNPGRGRSGTSKRSSKQSLNLSEPPSQSKGRRWRVIIKLRTLLRRGEETLRIWKERLMSRHEKGRSAGADLCVGH
ncbi:MAG: hypothetical protein LQ351_000896 [Letrouitia transgressa]|nr:MAG: hypothetical protein LQ351_000896 [Letrouitia transgressa]